MNFINMLGPTAWAVLLSLPPLIVLLYFLKLKRQPIEVPSTLLWRRAIEDLRVNSLWQKLRRSLLLWLQLLLLGLVMLAALRPGWAGYELSGSRYIFLVDVSASMQATDAGRPRIEIAKERVAELIAQMESGDEAMIITFSNRSTIVQSYTSNRKELLEKLNSVTATNRTSDLRDALVAAAGLANPGRANPGGANDVPVADPKPAELFLFSDGGFDTVRNFSLGNLEPKYVPIGKRDGIHNVAVTSFDVVQNPEQPERMQAFAQVENFGDETVEVQVELFSNDRPRDFDRVQLDAKSSRGVTFDLIDAAASREQQIVLRIELNQEDDLPLDNTAFVVTNPARRARVLVVSDHDEAFRLAFGTDEANELAEVTYDLPAVLDTQAFRQAAEDGTYDLILFDRCRPELMPQCNTLFFAALPPLDDWQHGEQSGSPVIIDTDGTHPLMELLNLRNLLILDAFSIEPPSGSHRLVESSIGCVFAVASRRGFEDAVLGFSLVTPGEGDSVEPNTDWPRLRSFPVFMHHVLRYLGGSRSLEAMPNTLPGELARLRAPASVEVLQVSPPQGKPEPVERNARNDFPFSNTAAVGVYDVRQTADADPIQKFAVNLFRRQESDIAVRDITIGYRDVEAQSAWKPARFELWKWLLLGALGVVVFEWYIFNKRTYL